MSLNGHIPFVDLVTPHQELEDELVAVFRSALGTAGFIGGPMVDGFEQRVCTILRNEFLRRGQQRNGCPAVRADGGRRGAPKHRDHRAEHVHRNGRSDFASRRSAGFCGRRSCDLHDGSGEIAALPRNAM